VTLQRAAGGRSEDTREERMVAIPSLWLPIVLAALLVFAASSVIHMGLGYHRTDFRKVPAEDELLAALRQFTLPPGDYMIPRAESPRAMRDPAFLDKLRRGPVMIATVLPSGPPSMARSLTLWFLYCVLVGVLSAYVAGRALGPGAPYLAVFRFAGTTAFVAYGLAMWHESIWYGRRWTTTLKFTIDGLVYGLLTGAAFGWLWPR
jgi:hypothetical protein